MGRELDAPPKNPSSLSSGLNSAPSKDKFLTTPMLVGNGGNFIMYSDWEPMEIG